MMQGLAISTTPLLAKPKPPLLEKEGSQLDLTFGSTI
jgi:hypothetical protein